MEIERYAGILWRRKWVIALTTIITVAVAAVGIHLMAPVYSASALVRLTYVTEAPISYTELTYTDRLMSTQVHVLNSRSSMEAIVEQLDLPLTPEALSRMVRIEAIPRTELISISAESTDPEQAMAIANGLSSLLSDQVAGRFTAQPIEPATLPLTPARPRPVLYLAVAGLLGFVGGLGLAFFFEHLDEAIYSVRDIEAMSGVSLLGTVPHIRSSKRSRGTRRYPGLDEDPLSGDVFRGLSVSVLALLTPRDAFGYRQHGRTLQITSTEPRTGKSLIALTLARAMAGSGYEVIVVDGNLQRAIRDRSLGDSNGDPVAGVAPVEASIEDALRSTGIPRLRVITGESAAAVLTQEVGADTWRYHIRCLAEMADIVLVDGPALLDSADAAILASAVDGVVLVAAKAQTTGEHIAWALEQLSRLQARTVGVVFNAYLARRGAGRGSHHKVANGNSHDAAANNVSSTADMTTLLSKRGDKS